MVKKSKSKRTSKPRTSHKGLIAGLSIVGVVALIAGVLVVLYLTGVFDDLFKKKSKPSRGSVPRKKVTVLDTFHKTNGPLPSQFEEGRKFVQTYRYDEQENLYLTISDHLGKLVNYPASIQKNPEFYEYFEIKIKDLGLIYKFTQDILTETVKDTEHTEPDLLLLQSVKDSDQSQRIYQEEATYEHYPDADVVVVIHASGYIVLPDVLFR
tara:strand:- start:13088 stop:13717 length:630 start_codon:yes stop_codon:yes gene_type:complete